MRGERFWMTMACVLLGTTMTKAEDWAQWRGPTRDGQAATSPTWPDKLDAQHLQQVWRIELGPSYSGPLVVGNRVFTTETRNAKDEYAFCLDRATGKTLWEAHWPGSIKVPFFAKANGDWIRATPACDGENLYVAGIQDVLVCLDMLTGEEKWRVDFVAQFGSKVPAFGFVSSPLVKGDALFVQAGGACFKLDRRTGKELWRALENPDPMQGSAFASPIIATVAGREHLLVQTRQQLAGVDLDSGKVLWSLKVPAFQGMNILTPTVDQGRIFTSVYSGKSYLFEPKTKGDAFEVSTVWTGKTAGYMSSPVLVNGFIYLHLQNQRFVCIDPQTGTERWRTTPYGKYWSLIAQGDRILALDEKGILYLIRANPEKFDLLDSRKVSDQETWAHLAVAEQNVYVRELKALAAYKWVKP